MQDFEDLPDRRRPIDGSPVRPSDFILPQPLGLEGRYVRLRRIDVDADSFELFACGHRHEAEALWRYMPYGPFPSEPRMREWLQRCAQSTDPLWFVARERAMGSSVGMAAIMEVRHEVGVAELGHIWFGPAHQGSREATEALFLLMDHVLTACRYRRLEWKCNALNGRSRRAARRLGFRYEGTFYNHTIVKGLNRDTAWFSILDCEWPPLRARLLAWLDPDNFDEASRQIGRLREMEKPGETGTDLDR